MAKFVLSNGSYFVETTEYFAVTKLAGRVLETPPFLFLNLRIQGSSINSHSF